MNQLKYLIYCFCLLALTNCDKYSIYTQEIRNNTSDTIRIYLEGSTAYSNGTDSIIALPNRDTIYYSSEGIKAKTKNHNCDPQISENEVTVETSSNRILLKDFANEGNWICETDGKNSFWNMYFNIEEGDLE